MNTLNQHHFSCMLQTATRNLVDQVPMLNELDSQTGDGDHGSTISRVCHCIQESIAAEPQGWENQISTLGWRIMEQDGGSASMLIGNLFLGISEGLQRDDLTPLETANAFQLGIERVKRLSGAKLGDKTMLDALVPAAEAMMVASEEDKSFPQLFQDAAVAARNGANSTKMMVAKRGRAKNMGDKAMGHIDPGATSMAILFASFSQSIEQQFSLSESNLITLD